jgi:hypothetical protein
MPNTFFIGDHFRMFPHLSERIIMADPERAANGIVADNVAVINAVNTGPIKEVANITEIKYEGGWETVEREIEKAKACYQSCGIRIH